MEQIQMRSSNGQLLSSAVRVQGGTEQFQQQQTTTPSVHDRALRLFVICVVVDVVVYLVTSRSGISVSLCRTFFLHLLKFRHFNCIIFK